MTLTSPHIRFLLAIALLVAIAPACATALTGETCHERACFATQRGVLGQVVKRPSQVSASIPRGVVAALPVLSRITLPSSLNVRYLPPAPLIPLRI